MQKTAVLVWTIHDLKDLVLAFDLADILQALEKQLDQWVWCITEFYGLNAQTLETEPVVDPVLGPVKWAFKQELEQLAKRYYQIIDGTFFAFPKGTSKGNIEINDLNLSCFPTSKADLVIRAVDSSFWEIYAKDPEIEDLLRRRFQDVRPQDSGKYFGEA